MEVSGELHAPAALPPREGAPGIHSEQNLMWPNTSQPK